MFHMSTLEKVGGVASCSDGRIWPLATSVPSVATSARLDGGMRLYCSPRDGGFFYTSIDIQKEMRQKKILPQEVAALVWHIYQRNRSWFDAMSLRGHEAPDMHAVKVLQNPHQFLASLPVLTPDWIQGHRHRSPSREELLTAFMGEIIYQADWPMKKPSLEEDISLALLNAASGCWARQAEDNQDLIELWQYCREQKWIRWSDLFAWPFMPTWHGRLAFEKRSANRAQNQRCFVAMWFGKGMQKIYAEGIAPAIRAVGYDPYRVDQELGYTGRLDERIEAQIRQARFMVADFTSGLVEVPQDVVPSLDNLKVKAVCKADAQGLRVKPLVRGGVYYEAGMAQGLGIPVIFTCNYRIPKYLHFDTRQYRHLVWQDPPDLYRQLIRHILANPLLGRGPRDCDEDAIATVLGGELESEH